MKRRRKREKKLGLLPSSSTFNTSIHGLPLNNPCPHHPNQSATQGKAPQVNFEHGEAVGGQEKEARKGRRSLSHKQVSYTMILASFEDSLQDDEKIDNNKFCHNFRGKKKLL